MKLYLFVLSYFHESKVVGGVKMRMLVEEPIYAIDERQAICILNDIYASNGKGHMHKSLVRHFEGITIEGQFYAPMQQYENSIERSS